MGKLAAKYEVFISYRNTNNGMQTEDSMIARELYEVLSANGIKTFFSGQSLAVLGADRYKEMIDRALDDCIILIVVGTSLENIQSNWVKYEWDSFFNDILIEKKRGRIFSYIDKMNPHDLPRTLRNLQCFEKKFSSLDSIVKYVKNALKNVESLEPIVHSNRIQLNKKEQMESVPEIKSFVEMLDLGFTPLKIARALVDNDNALYNLGDGHNNEGTPELWASFLEAYPDTFEYLICDNKIIGNYSLVALSEEQIEQLLKGELYEADFALEKNEPFVFPGNYVLYLLNFSVNMGWNTVDNYNKLWQSLLNKIEKYAHQGIFFERIYVNTFRADHRALYRRLGFKYVVDNKKKGQVFELKNFPSDLKWPNKELLMKIYLETETDKL